MQDYQHRLAAEQEAWVQRLAELSAGDSSVRAAELDALSAEVEQARKEARASHARCVELETVQVRSCQYLLGLLECL